jgi:hypothetical protein
MAEFDQDPIEQRTPAEPVQGGGSVPSSDPRDTRIAELERYYAESQGIFDRLKPHEEDVRALLDDEDYREFAREARQSYLERREKAKAKQAEELDPGARRLLEEFDRRLKPALEEVDVLRRDREARQAAEAETVRKTSEEFTRTNLEFAQRLVAEQGLSQEEVLDLGRFAKALHEDTVAAGSPRFVSIEEAYKRVYGRAQAKTETPRSLRSKAAAPGIPGASKPAEAARDPKKLGRPGGLTAHMLDVLNKKGA